MRRYLVLSGAAATLLLQSMASQAVTFARFDWITNKKNPLFSGNTLTLTATNSTNGKFSLAKKTNVTFQFQNTDQYGNTLPALYSADTKIDAVYTFTAIVESSARVSGTSHVEDFQQILFSYTSVSDANNTALGIPGGVNLLSGSSGFKQAPDGSPQPLSNGVGGTLSGNTNTPTPGFTGSDEDGSPLFDNAVLFSSHYIDFSHAFDKGFTWSFSNLAPLYTQMNVGPTAFIKGFTGEAGGQFDATVPEPGVIAMMVGMGLSGSALLARRRRRN